MSTTTTRLIPTEFEPVVRQAIESGRYGSEQEVVTAALKVWKVHEEQMDELRASLQQAADQLDRGEGIDGELVVQEMREKLARLRWEQCEVFDRN